MKPIQATCDLFLGFLSGHVLQHFGQAVFNNLLVEPDNRKLQESSLEVMNPLALSAFFLPQSCCLLDVFDLGSIPSKALESLKPHFFLSHSEYYLRHMSCSSSVYTHIYTLLPHENKSPMRSMSFSSRHNLSSLHHTHEICQVVCLSASSTGALYVNVQCWFIIGVIKWKKKQKSSRKCRWRVCQASSLIPVSHEDRRRMVGQDPFECRPWWWSQASGLMETIERVSLDIMEVMLVMARKTSMIIKAWHLVLEEYVQKYDWSDILAQDCEWKDVGEAEVKERSGQRYISSLPCMSHILSTIKSQTAALTAPIYQCCLAKSICWVLYINHCFICWSKFHCNMLLIDWYTHLACSVVGLKWCWHANSVALFFFFAV